MTINDFKALDNTRQADEIWNGTFLACRIYQDFHVLLYNVYEFYVEIYCSFEIDYISNMKTFESTDLLDPYLDEMDIEELQQIF